MGDTWQYRVRVSGPDRAKWFEKATAHKWGGKLPHYEWPMEGSFAKGKTYPVRGNWYNVEIRSTEDYFEFFGNFSGYPASYFRSRDSFRAGPALFARMNITVEIVGQSWHADCPGGIYSYRDIYTRGKRTKTEKSDSASVAAKYAPELLKEFPDDYTAAEREEMARDDAEAKVEAAREKAEEAAAKRREWKALRPGAMVEIRHPGKTWAAAGKTRVVVVESVTTKSGIFRETFNGDAYGGSRLVVKFSEKFSIKRVETHCDHGVDRRFGVQCLGCERRHQEAAQMVKYMLDGLHSRVVL